MPYEIVHHLTAGRRLPKPTDLRAMWDLRPWEPIFRRLTVRSREDIQQVKAILRPIQFDGREKTVSLAIPRPTRFEMPALFDDDLTYNEAVLHDLRRLVRLGHVVTVSIFVPSMDYKD